MDNVADLVTLGELNSVIHSSFVSCVAGEYPQEIVSDLSMRKRACAELASSATKAHDVKEEQAQRGQGTQAAEDATSTDAHEGCRAGFHPRHFLARWAKRFLGVNASTTFRAWSRPGSRVRNNIEVFRLIFEKPRPAQAVRK